MPVGDLRYTSTYSLFNEKEHIMFIQLLPLHNKNKTSIPRKTKSTVVLTWVKFIIFDTHIPEFFENVSQQENVCFQTQAMVITHISTQALTILS